MDLVLLTITVGSLGLAAGLGIIGWKLLRHGHAATDARVEHLRALAAQAVEVEHDGPALAHERHDHSDTPVAAHAPIVIEQRPGSTPVPALLSTFRDTDEPELDWDGSLGHLPTVEALADDHLSAPLFAPPEPSSAPTRRLALVAAVAIVMIGSAGTAYAVYRPQTLSARGASSSDSAAAATAPLDLLSLNQTVDAEGSFVVTGLVGNPAAGRPVERVMAVVYLFDRDGHYFATGRAGIDQASLAPGDQSPFIVKIAHGTSAARYRVGFRQLDGAVVAHVDKRGQALEGTTEVSNAGKGSGQ